MFEHLVELMERLVVATEAIAAQSITAQSMACGCKTDAPTAVEAKPEPEEWTKEWAEQTSAPVEEHPSVAELAEADKAYHHRESVKDALRKYGKKFKESARTETLDKMLEECKLQAVEEPAEPAEEPASYTKDDVRAALVKLSTAKGKDAALQVLRQHGGADKLGDVDPAKFGEIMEACNG